MRNLTQTANDRFFGLFAAIATATWAVVSIFGTAFQCSVPNTWDFWNGKCFDLVCFPSPSRYLHLLTTAL